MGLSAKKTVVGSVIVLTIASLLTVSNIIAKQTMVPPLFLVYINVCFNVFGFVLALIVRCIGKCANKQKQNLKEEEVSLSNHAHGESSPAQDGEDPNKDGEEEAEPPRLSQARIRWTALALMLVYQTGNVLYFYGLQSALQLTQTTVLYQSTTVFVFLFSLGLLKEEVQPFKVAAILCVVAGAAVTAFSPPETGMMSHMACMTGSACFMRHMGDNMTAFNATHPMPMMPMSLTANQGAAFLLMAAALQSLYETLIPILLPHATVADINTFIGWRGVWNILLFWPIVAAQAALGGPNLYHGLYSSMVNWAVVVRMGLLGVLAICISTLVAVGITVAGPVFLRVGAPMESVLTLLFTFVCGPATFGGDSVCSIPLSFHPESWQIIVGNVFALGGFVFVMLQWKWAAAQCTTTAPLTRCIKAILQRCKRKGEESEKYRPSQIGSQELPDLRVE